MDYKILPYNTSLSLLTDLYQLTMSCGYFKSGKANEEAVFHLFYRKNPFKGNYAIACGLEQVIDLIRNFSFSDDDISFLSELTGNDNKPLFDLEFLNYLSQMEFSCEVDAVPEGTVVFPHEPLLRIQGPIIQCQILETAMLNIINFQTLIATKSSRICYAAQGEPVMEFGLRRAQGIDGGLSASRASYVGGCSSTSNLLAGKLFGIPVKGTHAHSWVMSFDDEIASFEAYAKAMPNNCVFLVDTYDTITGVRRAIEVAQKLKKSGHQMIGVRLDSGDFVDLSIKARKLLDSAGFTDAKIIASNDLDELKIQKLKNSGAQINVWGIGTKLVTGDGQPALGGVFKISSLRTSKDEPWQYKVKLSEEKIKVSNPGILQIRRFYNENSMVEDVLYNIEDKPADTISAVKLDSDVERSIDSSLNFQDLLVPIFREGKLVYGEPTLSEMRELAQKELSSLKDELLSIDSQSEAYCVSLEKSLSDKKESLIKKIRETISD